MESFLRSILFARSLMTITKQIESIHVKKFLSILIVRQERRMSWNFPIWSVRRRRFIINSYITSTRALGRVLWRPLEDKPHLGSRHAHRFGSLQNPKNTIVVPGIGHCASLCACHTCSSRPHEANIRNTGYGDHFLS